MVIYDDNVSRKLNNLELFVAIYEFVADRVYVEQDTSHDIIGTLITNKGVCQGYCQLMSFLCDHSIFLFYIRIQKLLMKIKIQ